MDLKFRDTMSPDVVQELDRYTATLNQYLYAEHDHNGKHADIVPRSITLQGARIGEFVDIPYDATRFTATSGGSTWTVDSADVGHLRFCRIGQLVTVQFRLTDTTIAGATTSSLHINLPELQMHPQQDFDGFNIQMAGVLEVDDSDGTCMGDITAGADTTGTSTVLVLKKFHQVAAPGTEPRDFQTGNVAVMGIAQFFVTVNNAAQAFN